MANGVQDHTPLESTKRTEQLKGREDSERVNPKFKNLDRTATVSKYVWTGKPTHAALPTVPASSRRQSETIINTAQQLRELKERYRKEKRELERELTRKKQEIEGQWVSAFEKRPTLSSKQTERWRARLADADSPGKQIKLREQWIESYEADVSRLEHLPQLEKQLEHTADPKQQRRLQEKIHYAKEAAERRLHAFTKQTKLSAWRAASRRDARDERAADRLLSDKRNALEIAYRKEEKALRGQPFPRGEHREISLRSEKQVP